jgi:hypothetical protein
MEGDCMRIEGGYWHDRGRVLEGTMKHAALILAILCASVTLANNRQAQIEPTTSPAEPQYINSFYGVDANGKLIELERKAVTFHSKMKVLPGYATVKMTTEFKPGRSPVRVAAIAQFIVRGRAPIDPLSRFELRALKYSKGHREFVMTQGHGSIFGGSATSNLDEGAVAIRFEEYGISSYRITTDQPLAPGEYALAVRGFASELYCFGVDR